jgi:hypothetical protein
VTPACPVCDAEMEQFDTAVVLGRYDVTYHHCPSCGLVATRETPWLQEAYSSAIHDADAGLLRRAHRYQRLAAAVIRSEGLRRGRFLDWAGGYGVFTQLMRDRGYDTWQHDDFAEPVFARGFRDPGDGRYDLITAFEVFEHLADPRRQLDPLAGRSDRLLFTTETLPAGPPKVADWWYYMPGVGQHITFHTVASLRKLGEHLGFSLTSNGTNWHLFHRGSLDLRTRALLSGHTTGAARKVRYSLARLRR